MIGVLLHLMIGTLLSGLAVVIVLVAGGGLWPLLGAFALGQALALPCAWGLARRMR
jgi:hypothetical protein